MFFIVPIIFLYIKWNPITLYLSQKAVDNGFCIENIHINGVNFFDKSDILKVINIPSKSNIFSLNLNDLVAKLLLSISWIKDIKIERKYPNTLIIKIMEREPIGYFQYQSKLYLIDNQGVLIQSNKKIKDGIIFVGQLANKKAFELIKLLKKYKIENVTSAAYIGKRRWNIEIANKTVVKLPEHGLEPVMSDLSALILNKKILEKDISIIDFRIPDKVLVRESRGRLNYNEI